MKHWHSDATFDSILRIVCSFRVLLALPRPYFWFHAHRMFVEARNQPTPQLVRERLLGNLGSHQLRVDRLFMIFYHVWLLAVTVIVWFAPVRQTLFAEDLWVHCQVNYVWILTHRVVCVSMFYFLKNSKINRGIPEQVLEKYTKLIEFKRPWDGFGGEECAICFGEYAEGESVRVLNCRHHFHQSCVDVWLLERHNHCPFCNGVVGPASTSAQTRPGPNANEVD
jgi:hypothetical protein